MSNTTTHSPWDPEPQPLNTKHQTPNTKLQEFDPYVQQYHRFQREFRWDSGIQPLNG